MLCGFVLMDTFGLKDFKDFTCLTIGNILFLIEGKISLSSSFESTLLSRELG